MSKVYNLDPDFRKDPDIERPFCCRCQKPLKETADKLTGIPVTVNWESWTVAEGHNQFDAVKDSRTSDKVIGNELMGRDCWKQITAAGERE